MKTPLFYSLRPAGDNIPLSVVFSSLIQNGKNASLPESKPLNEFLDGAYSLFMSSGRAALWLILKALSKLRPNRRKVIIPAYTCPALTSAVLKADLKPVLCDINLQDFGYNLDQLQSKLDDNALGVVSVHLFGFPSNIEAVVKLCKDRSLFVIEDAAQAFGNVMPLTGKKLGLIADVGFFSFGRGKPLSALHGGLVGTKSKAIYGSCCEVYEKIDRASGRPSAKYSFDLGCYSLFSAPHLYWIPQRIPALHLGETVFEPDFDVSPGLKNASKVVEKLLPFFKEEQASRLTKVQWFSEQFRDLPGISKPPLPGYAYNRYPLVLADRKIRDDLLRELPFVGIGAGLFYPCPLNELPVLSDILGDETVYQNAKRLSDVLITLPVHEGVTERDMRRIASTVIRVLSGSH